MTNATTETTKLNFITDQGSTRAMVRCADRFDCFFCAALRAVAGPWPAAVWAGLADEGAVLGAADVLGAAGRLPVMPARRKVRAGDDDELGGGSGICHANAAGDTGGGSAGAGGVLDDGLRGGMVPEGAVGDGSSTGALAACSAGSAAVRFSGSGSGSLDLLPRDAPMVSAGNAGTPPATVASAAAAREASF